jgi:hypothetical protein
MADQPSTGSTPTRVGAEGLTVPQAQDRILALLADLDPEKPAPDSDDTTTPASAEAEVAVEEEAPPADEAEEPEPDADAAPPRKTYKVPVDGEEVEVDEAELVKGYSREAHFTRKMQKLAEERRLLEEELQSVREERHHYGDLLPKLKAALEVPQVDWDKLRADNPEQFTTKWAEYQLAVSRQRAVDEEQAALAAKTRAEQDRLVVAYVEQERGRLLEAVPEWKDEAARTKDRTAMAQVARTTGFTDEELADVTDHRALILLRKAMLWDQHTARVKGAQRKVAQGPVAKPGGGQPRAAVPAQQAAYTKAKERLANTGKVADAASALMHLIPD